MTHIVTVRRQMVNTLLLHADCFTCKTDVGVQFSFLFSVWFAAAILAG